VEAREPREEARGWKGGMGIRVTRKEEGKKTRNEKWEG
jgi:hypothetical protein